MGSWENTKPQYEQQWNTWVTKSHTSEQQWNIWDKTEPRQWTRVRHMEQHKLTWVRRCETPEMMISHHSEWQWDPWGDANTLQRAAVRALVCWTTPVSISKQVEWQRASTEYSKTHLRQQKFTPEISGETHGVKREHLSGLWLGTYNDREPQQCTAMWYLRPHRVTLMSGTETLKWHRAILVCSSETSGIMHVHTWNDTHLPEWVAVKHLGQQKATPVNSREMHEMTLSHSSKQQ